MAGGASTLRDALLPVVDVMRGIPGAFGMRLHTVSVIQRNWTGDRAGVGSAIDFTTGVKIDLGIYQTKVTQVTERDVVASGGQYSMQDLIVGPITPPFAGGALDNNAITVFDPALGAGPIEVFFHIVGPACNTPGGGWFKKIAQDTSKSFRYMFTVRRSETP